MSQYTSNTPRLLFENFCRKTQVDGLEITADISGIPVKLKVLTTPRSQEKGFSGAANPPNDNSGLLFIYDDGQPLSFWMKGVMFPLDIVFFDSEMNYINHETMQPANGRDDSLSRYFSKKPARFAVELPAGWCDKNINSDCKLKF